MQKRFFLPMIGMLTAVLASACNCPKSPAAVAVDVAVAQADGDHSVAIQQCLALIGEPQKSCKDRADASYVEAKIHANVTRLSKLE